MVSVSAGLGSNCGESLVCSEECQGTKDAGALWEDEVGKRCTGLGRKLALQFRNLKPCNDFFGR